MLSEMFSTEGERPVLFKKEARAAIQRLLQVQQCSICNYYRVRPFLFVFN